MLGLISAINALIGKITDVITQLTAIAQACGTIATNTTPADSSDSTPDADPETT